MNILILATSPTSLAVKRIKYEAVKRGHTVLIVNPMDLFIRISSSSSGYDSIYMKEGKKVRKLLVKDVDAVIPRIGTNVNYAAFIIEHLHSNLKIFSTNPAEGIRTASNQLKTLQKLSSNGLPTPRTVYIQNPQHINSAIDQLGGFPIVTKLNYSSGGAGVSLLKDRNTAIPIIQSLIKSNSSFIMQEFLPAKGIDYRCLVYGNELIKTMERSAARGGFRANLKLNGSGKPVNLSDEDKDLAIRACKATGLFTGGIDLIKSKGRSYILESNANHGWEIEKICNHNIALDLIQFCEQNYQKLIPGKQKTLNYEKLLSEERQKNEQLIHSILQSNTRYRSLVGSPYIREVYKKAKGHNVSYTDRDKRNREIRVETIDDIFTIMKETFTIK